MTMARFFKFSPNIFHLFVHAFIISQVWCNTATTTTTKNPDRPHLETCTLEGTIYTHRPWYGYLTTKVFGKLAIIHYDVSLPLEQAPAKLALYYQSQLDNLTSSMMCEERIAGLHSAQIISLDKQTIGSGCRDVDDVSSPGKKVLVCRHRKTISSRTPRRWSFVVARCGQSGPLKLHYTFNISGFLGECEEDPLNRYQLPAERTDTEVMYASVCDGNSAVGMRPITELRSLLWSFILFPLYLVALF